MAAILSNVTNSISRGLAAGVAAMSRWSILAAQAAWKLSVLSVQYVRDAIRAHYHLLGQYTFDIENKIAKKAHPPTFSKKPFYLLFQPIGLITILLSVTIIPLIANSIQTFKAMFLIMLRLILPQSYTKSLTKEIKQNDQNNLQIFLYGAIGALAGFIISLPVAAAIFCGRVVYNSLLTGYRTFSSVVNLLALHKSNDPAKDDSIPKEYTLKDPKFLDVKSHIRYGFGLPGLVLGGLLGVVATLPIGLGRVYTNTYKTLSQIACAMMDRVLPTEYQIKQEKDTRSVFFKYGLGVLGIPLGFVTGFVCMLGIALVRTFTNSLYTASKMFCIVVNPLLYKKDEQDNDQLKFKSDPTIDGDPAQDMPADKACKYGFGLPGYPIGIILGVAIGWPVVIIGRFITNNVKSMGFAITKILQALIDPTDHHEIGIDNIKDTKRHWVRSYILGFPGTVVGTAIGSVLGIFIVIGRTLTNSAYTFHKMFAKIAGTATEKDYDFGFVADKKIEDSFLRNVVFGWSGYVLGTIVGSAAAVFAILPARYFKNSAQTAVQVAQDIINVPSETERKYEDNRSVFRKYVVGFPGVIAGVLMGIPAALAIVMYRGAYDSVYTFGKTFSRIVNVFLHEEDQIDFVKEEDQDKKTEKLIIFSLNSKLEDKNTRYFGFGLVGHVIGALYGVFLGAPVIFVGRLITNTAKSIYYTTIEMMKAVIDNEDIKNSGLGNIKDKDPKDPKANYRRLGALGRLIGIATGLVAMSVIIIGRTLSNSSYTSYKMFRLIVSPVLHKKDKDKLPLAFDKDLEKSFVRNGVFGWPGYILGTVTGAVIGLPVVIIGRIITNSAKSIFYTVIRVIQALVNPSDQKNIHEIKDNRDIHQHVLGMPGYVLGAAVGLVVGALIVMGRILTNSAYMYLKAIKQVTDKVLHDNDQLPFSANTERENDPACRRYGVPGYLLGIAVGGVFAGMILGGRVLTNTGKSWLALSKSLLNIALERELFYGVGADQRLTRFQVAGLLGYVLAGVTTFPLALSIYFLRKLPTLCSGVLGVLFAPVVLFCKAISKGLIKDPRFSHKHVGSEDLIIKKFKNLYSNLTTFGELDTGVQINDNLSGDKPIGSFVRKCLTFDQNTTTETILSALLKAYLATPDSHKATFFTENLDNEPVKKIKHERFEQDKSNCFVTENEQAKFEAEVDKVAEFIHNYMTTRSTIIPTKLYQGDEPSWGALFLAAPDKTTTPPLPYHGSSLIQGHDSSNMALKN